MSDNSESERDVIEASLSDEELITEHFDFTIQGSNERETSAQRGANTIVAGISNLSATNDDTNDVIPEDGRKNLEIINRQIQNADETAEVDGQPEIRIPDIVRIIQENDEANQLFDAIRRRTIPLLYSQVGLTVRSPVTKEDIPKFIEEGIKICVGVFQNKRRSVDCGWFESLKRLTIYGDIIMRRIYKINDQLGDQKLSGFQLFGHFLSKLRDEIVKQLLENDLVRFIIRQVHIWVPTRPTFATGVVQVLVVVFACYAMYQYQS